jgi:retron-type reverse transcriptase
MHRELVLGRGGNRLTIHQSAGDKQAVRGVEIPKPGGGMRLLGIPTAVDRLIQQALHQLLMPLFDPGFSEASYGFRPGRSAHAVLWSISTWRSSLIV